jgi:hypothetical protein
MAFGQTEKRMEPTSIRFSIQGFADAGMLEGATLV